MFFGRVNSFELALFLRGQVLSLRPRQLEDRVKWKQVISERFNFLTL